MTGDCCDDIEETCPRECRNVFLCSYTLSCTAAFGGGGGGDVYFIRFEGVYFI